MATHLLLLVLDHVGLELEVGAELAGAELAQVGAVDEDHLLGLRLAPFILACRGQGLGLCGAGQGLAQPYAERKKSQRRVSSEAGQEPHHAGHPGTATTALLSNAVFRTVLSVCIPV